MASSVQGTYLVYQTVSDVNRIKDSLSLIHDLIDRIGERFGALGTAAQVLAVATAMAAL